MRFFPHDAFKNPPEAPVQMPVGQVQFQQFQPMYQFQQQTWQQVGIPQVSIAAPFFLVIQQMRAQQQILEILIGSRPSPMWIELQFADPIRYFLDPGGF